jgi:hypothetical protein
MSWLKAEQPELTVPRCSALESVIEPRPRDLGGFQVRRVLPSGRRQMVGPFIFFDQMGPSTLEAGQGIDVRPHPHIGLATVTYLFEGEILHRDSLGSSQPIRPGDVNWMTAGRGIVHSERTPPEVRSAPSRLYGIQAWVALPQASAEREPDFTHYPAESLPRMERDGLAVTLIAGNLFGERSPVRTDSPLFYADATLDAGAGLSLPGGHAERGIYVVQGRLEVGGEAFDAGRLLVFAGNDTVAVRALEPCRLMLLGGEPVDGQRLIWWNFVASTRERIEQAKADWAAGRFPPVPGDDERIPLPD